MARQKQKKWQVYFDLNAPRKGGPRKQHPGRELPIRLAFSWGEAEWRIPAVYVCAQGLVVDFVRRVPAGHIQGFMAGHSGGSPDRHHWLCRRADRRFYSFAAECSKVSHAPRCILPLF